MSHCPFCGSVIREECCSFAQTSWHNDLIHACNEFRTVRQETDYRVGQTQCALRFIERDVIKLQSSHVEPNLLTKKQDELRLLCRKIEKIVNDGGRQMDYWREQVNACLQQKHQAKKRTS